MKNMVKLSLVLDVLKNELGFNFEQLNQFVNEVDGSFINGDTYVDLTAYYKSHTLSIVPVTILKEFNPDWVEKNLQPDEWSEGKWLNIEAITVSEMEADAETAYYEYGK